MPFAATTARTSNNHNVQMFRRYGIKGFFPSHTGPVHNSRVPSHKPKTATHELYITRQTSSSKASPSIVNLPPLLINAVNSRLLHVVRSKIQYKRKRKGRLLANRKTINTQHPSPSATRSFFGTQEKSVKLSLSLQRTWICATMARKEERGWAEFEAETETGAVNGMEGQFRFQRAIFLSFFLPILYSLSLALWTQ